MISAAAPLADVARTHRDRWVAARCGDRPITRLDAATDLAAALRDALAAAEPGALVLDGLPPDGLPDDVLDGLAAAAERGWGVVVAVHGAGDALPAAPSDEPEATAADIAARLPGAEVVPQRLAEVSIIAEPGTPVTAQLDGVDGDPVDVEAWLVVAGLAAPEQAEPIAIAIGTVQRAYARWLDAANAALRQANVRLAREKLGAYDAAAASTARRIVAAEEERDAIREEMLKVRDEAVQYFQVTQRKLAEPHYRVAEGIARRAGRVPGARFVGRAVTRRMLPPPSDPS